MMRFLGRLIALEFLALLVAEFGLALVMAGAFLRPGSGDGLPARAVLLAVLIAGLAGLVSFVLGAYRAPLFFQVRGVLKITVLGAGLLLFAVWMAGHVPGLFPEAPPNLRALAVGLLWVVLLLAIRLLFMSAVRLGLLVRPVAVLGRPETVSATIAALRMGRPRFFQIVPAPADEPLALRRAGIRHALAAPAALSGLGPEGRQGFERAGVELLSEPEFWFRHLKRISVPHLTPDWFAELDRRPPSRAQHFINRAGDIMISGAFLLFTAPLMALVAVVVRLESPGPVLYRQERVGLGGKPFVVLKFRSMNANAEAKGPAWAQARDPRVTRIGSVMRRTRIDELPQLINVLRGEMSFIGPRPERPHFVEQLAEVIPFYRERSRVKPGLTGWAQVNYPYGASVEDAEAKLSYDLYYVQNRSVWLDLATLFATVRVIVFQEGSR